LCIDAGQRLRSLLLGDVLDYLDEAGGPVIRTYDRVGADACREAGTVVPKTGGLGLVPVSRASRPGQ
jgi:hypothetical protein